MESCFGDIPVTPGIRCGLSFGVEIWLYFLISVAGHQWGHFSCPFQLPCTPEHQGQAESVGEILVDHKVKHKDTLGLKPLQMPYLHYIIE